MLVMGLGRAVVVGALMPHHWLLVVGLVSRSCIVAKMWTGHVGVLSIPVCLAVVLAWVIPTIRHRCWRIAGGRAGHHMVLSLRPETGTGLTCRPTVRSGGYLPGTGTRLRISLFLGIPNWLGTPNGEKWLPEGSHHGWTGHPHPRSRGGPGLWAGGRV